MNKITVTGRTVEEAIDWGFSSCKSRGIGSK